MMRQVNVKRMKGDSGRLHAAGLIFCHKAALLGQSVAYRKPAHGIGGRDEWKGHRAGRWCPDGRTDVGCCCCCCGNYWQRRHRRRHYQARSVKDRPPTCSKDRYNGHLSIGHQHRPSILIIRPISLAYYRHQSDKT